MDRDDRATTRLLDAARLLDRDLSRETYLEAFEAAMFVGHLESERLREVAEAVRTRAPAREPPRPVDLLLDALTDQMTLRDGAAVPGMQRAVMAFRKYAIDRISDRAQASGTDWAVGVELRSRALLTEGPDAGELYRQAVERLERSGMRAHLARARLVHGEWLRRRRRRVEARDEASGGTRDAVGDGVQELRSPRGARARGHG